MPTCFCFRITTVFSHAQTVVVCAGCSTVLCQPTGGRARYIYIFIHSKIIQWLELYIE